MLCAEVLKEQLANIRFLSRQILFFLAQFVHVLHGVLPYTVDPEPKISSIEK